MGSVLSRAAAIISLHRFAFDRLLNVYCLKSPGIRDLMTCIIQHESHLRRKEGFSFVLHGRLVKELESSAIKS